MKTQKSEMQKRTICITNDKLQETQKKLIESGHLDFTIKTNKLTSTIEFYEKKDVKKVVKNLSKN